jgi:hypothetical protein
MSARCTALLLLLTGACVDTKGRFDDYNDRFEDYKKRLEAEARDAAAGFDGGACESPELGELQGRYLFAFAAALDKTRPILMSLTLTPIKGSKTDLTAVFTPLSVEGLKPTGESVETTMRIDDTSFAMEKVHLLVPGDTNPLQPGLDAEADVTLSGSICADANGKTEFVCGDGVGLITDPLEVPLDGSEFGALRVEEGDPWPKPVSTCAMGRERT